jgi:hypothetical protein
MQEHQQTHTNAEECFSAICQLTNKIDEVLTQNKLLQDTIHELQENQNQLKVVIENITTDKITIDDETVSNDTLEKEICELQQKFEQMHSELKSKLNTNLKNHTTQQLTAQCQPSEFQALKKLRHQLELWYPHAQTTVKHIMRSPEHQITRTKTNPYITTTFHQTIIPIDRFNDLTKQLHNNTRTTTLLLIREDLMNTLSKMESIYQEMESNKELSNLAVAKAWKAVARGHGDLSDRNILGKPINNRKQDHNDNNYNDNNNTDNYNTNNNQNHNRDHNSNKHNNDYHNEQDIVHYPKNRNTHIRREDNREPIPVRQPTKWYRNKTERIRPQPERRQTYYDTPRQYRPHPYYTSRRYDDDFPELTADEDNYRRHKYYRRTQRPYYDTEQYNTETEDEYYLN